MHASKLALTLLVLTAFVPAAAAQNTVRHYRYSLHTRSQDLRFAQEVPASVSGNQFVVEMDAEGRIVSVSSVRNGKTTARRVYRFATGQKLASGYESFDGDDPAGRVEIQRNAVGDRTRENNYTLAGTLTGYATYTYLTETVEQKNYNPEGKLKSRALYSYSPRGIMITQEFYSNPDEKLNHVDAEYDEGTGLAKATKQFRNGALLNSRSLTYNTDNDLIREDSYDPHGKPYVFRELADGLNVRKVYKSADEITKELRYTYDDKRRLKQTDLYSKGSSICRFIYDRMPDGTVKETRALGPKGELWAEYPDQEIMDVERDGKPINGIGATVYKVGNWW